METFYKRHFGKLKMPVNASKCQQCNYGIYHRSERICKATINSIKNEAIALFYNAKYYFVASL